MADPYRFATLGPFPVPLKWYRKRRQVDFSMADTLVFQAAEQQSKSKLQLSGINKAIGCYVFALKPPGGQIIWPYYVGQSCRQTLGKRVFQKSDKIAKYNAILKEYRTPLAFVYLLPLVTPGGNFARLGTNQKTIDLAEQSLIDMALRVNYSLWNIKHRKEGFTIDGTPLTDKRDTKPAASFRRLLGFANYDRPDRREKGEIQPAPQSTEDLEEFALQAVSPGEGLEGLDMADPQIVNSDEGPRLKQV
jgi:hypothetical protein